MHMREDVACCRSRLPAGDRLAGRVSFLHGFRPQNPTSASEEEGPEWMGAGGMRRDVTTQVFPVAQLRSRSPNENRAANMQM